MVRKINFTNKEKILIIILLAIVVIISGFLVNEMILKDLNPPSNFVLISNENGVSLYKDSSTNVFMEVKEANNPTKTYHSNCAGKKANVTVKFVKYTITCYKEVQSVPNVPAVQIYTSGAGELSSQFALSSMLGNNHLSPVDGGIVDLYD